MMYDKSAPQSIQEMFSNVASCYDKANTFMSLGLHKFWNRQLIDKISEKNPKLLLDLCAGTGDIALGFLKKNSHSKALLVDFCKDMLSLAQKKAEDFQLSNRIVDYRCGDAHHLPVPDDAVDAVTIAYGIRNVKDPLVCCQEAWRVLKNKGRLAVLELTRPQNGFMKVGHKIYLKGVIPVLGKWLTSDKNAYNYLAQSIDQFIAPKDLGKIFEKANFKNVKTHSLMGGIASIIIGEKEPI